MKLTSYTIFFLFSLALNACGNKKEINEFNSIVKSGIWNVTELSVNNENELNESIIQFDFKENQKLLILTSANIHEANWVYGDIFLGLHFSNFPTQLNYFHGKYVIDKLSNDEIVARKEEQGDVTKMTLKK